MTITRRTRWGMIAAATYAAAVVLLGLAAAHTERHTGSVTDAIDARVSSLGTFPAGMYLFLGLFALTAALWCVMRWMESGQRKTPRP